MSYWKKFVEFLTKGLSVSGLEGSGVRAKDSKGRFVADDKSTVNVNEAYKDGKTPVKRNKRTQTKGKGSQKPKSKKGRGRPKGSKNKKK